MDSQQAVIMYLDEIEKALAGLSQALPAAAREAAANLQAESAALQDELARGLARVLAALQDRVYPTPEPLAPLIDAVRSSILANAAIERLHAGDLRAEVERLLESQARIAAALENIQRPRKWRFHIKRHPLDGHILGVTAEADDG